jgi:acetyltransferase-like isoleucine patch superfamily enzyme
MSQKLAPKEHTSGSPVRAYLDLQVGKPGLLSLLQYELVASLGARLPGAFGLALRRFLWPGLFRRSGRKVVWGRNVTVRHPGKMSIGNRVLVDDDCFFDAKGCAEGGFQIGDDVVISRGCIVSGKGAWLELGPRVNLGPGCQLFSMGGLRIGSDTLLAGRCYVGGGGYDHAGPVDEPMNRRPVVPGPVEVGRDCWLGAGVIVIAGVTVGEGSVIGAGSVVTRDIPPYSIAVGVPARVVNRRPSAPPAE